MKVALKITLLLTTLLVCGCGVAEPPQTRSITHEAMSIDIPAEWESKKVKDPRVFNVGNPIIRLVVVREPKKEMGVENLAEYFELKFEKISDRWQDLRIGQRKSFTLHGRNAILINGSATVQEPKTLATTFYLMTVEGADYYYFAYLLNTMKGGQGTEDLRRILETLKVH